MKTQEFDGIVYQVDDRFEGFTIVKKPSSNVDFIGYDENTQVFIQFKNGGAYLYKDIQKETVEKALESESIGKFIRAEITGKFPSVKLGKSVLTAEPTF